MEIILIIVAILVFLSLIFGFVYLFYKAIRNLKVKKYRRGIVYLSFSIIIGFILVSLLFAVHGARKLAQRAGCSSNLKQIVLFLKMYANDHQETYPSTFNGMRGEYIKPFDEAVLVCPESNHKSEASKDIHEWTDYAFVSGLSEADHAGCVVAFCLPDRHQGEGANVAFIGGNVQWFSCRPFTNSWGHCDPTFQELTNKPSLFFGTTNELELIELMSRTKIIYPRRK